MSTETANSAPPNLAPPANAAPANAAPAAQPAAKPKYEVDYDPNNPPWLNERLERERKNAAKEAESNVRKALLAELGVDDPEVVKKLATEEKKRAEAQKSLEQKVAEREQKLAEQDAKLKRYQEATSALASEQLAALSEDRKAAVLKLAGDDPARQIETIAALRPTWGSSQPATQQSTTQTQAANASQGTTANAAPPPVVPAKPAPATAPGAVAPPPADAVVVENHLETYEYLAKNSPFYAADYLQANYAAIVEARSKRGS